MVGEILLYLHGKYIASVPMVVVIKHVDIAQIDIAWHRLAQTGTNLNSRPACLVAQTVAHTGSEN